ncbi:hypothetical protein RJ639_031765 [Escallonia herrerae]|uniref:Uncharacterized protein n=1 Tax=Escallonia herrerae TaxID=1293975 RepID=A0AA89BD50_9ASTE|nr:hypothetical protein RJ639_031765 [Escallonia herrerae]
MGDLFAWLISFFIIIAIIGLLIYQLMCLADLELDYINPYDTASRINHVVLPEFVTQGILCALHLISGHWFTFLLCLPCLYYNMKVVSSNQVPCPDIIKGLWILAKRGLRSNETPPNPHPPAPNFYLMRNLVTRKSYSQRRHQVDVTEIFNHLPWEKKQRLLKLSFHAILLMMSIFWMIWSVVDH